MPGSLKLLEKQELLKRKLLPQHFKVETWAQLEPYFAELKLRTIDSATALENWLADLSELETVISEDAGWRYIRMTCDTANKELVDAYTLFVEEISPNMEPYSDQFNKKLMASSFLKQLDEEKYKIYIRRVKNDLELFRDENIPLMTKSTIEEQKYATIMGAMTIRYKDKDLTLQQAALFLEDEDRSVREEVYRLIQKRRSKDTAETDKLFDTLLSLRFQIAANAGFANFRDYKYKAMGRFDYSIKDCFNFHDAIQEEFIPIIAQADAERKRQLAISALRPWDLEVDTEHKQPLSPFSNGEDLINKSIRCFTKVRPYYGECLEVMRKMDRFDLESRKGKAPGGYNYPLNETGVPFVFMNSVGLHRDLVTMVHEGGHAIHAFLTNDLELAAFKNYPSEVAELASMSMELISMEHWDVFFSNPDDLKRARKEQLEKIIRILPWIAVVDKFQHWLYENINPSAEQRAAAWTQLVEKFSSPVMDYTGLEVFRAHSWHNQLHIFEVPFYYIEYGIAQLGAIAIWRNYRNNPEKALDAYEAALKLGYTKSIPEIYAAAGIKFDFSKQYVHELMEFVKQEIKRCN